MIKIKDILIENKIAALNEAFKAGKLRALSGNKWDGLG